MAKKKSLEELDAEMARLEAELKALAEGRAPPEPAEPEELDELPEPAEAPGKRGLKGRFKRKRAEGNEARDEGTAPEPEEAEAPEEPADAPKKGGFMGRMRRSKEAPGEPAVGMAEDAAPSDEPEPERAEEEALPPALAPEDRLTDEPSTDLPVTPWKREAIPRAHPERWQETQEGWLRREGAAVEEPAMAEHEEKRRLPFMRRREKGEEGPPPEAGALLARFEEAPVEAEERKRKVWPILLVLLLLAAVIAVIAFLLLGGDDGGGGGGDVVASIVTTGPTTAQGEAIGSVGRAVAFDASDTEGEVDEYNWDFGDGSTAATTAPEATHTYTAAGTYTVTLTAGGSSDELTVIVVAAPVANVALTVNGAPLAAPGTVGNNVFVGDTLTADGSASSSDARHPIASYEWDTNGDGQADETGEQAELTFSEPGMFIVTLTVTDDLGNTDSSTPAMVHVGLRALIEDTVSASLPPDPATNEHPITVDAGRGGATPVQVRAILTYTPVAGPAGPLPVAVEDVDLIIVDAAGTEFAADDDSGAGSEEITVTDLSALGPWTVRIRHELGGAMDIAYTVVVEVVY